MKKHIALFCGALLLASTNITFARESQNGVLYDLIDSIPSDEYCSDKLAVQACEKGFLLTDTLNSVNQDFCSGNRNSSIQKFQPPKNDRFPPPPDRFPPPPDRHPPFKKPRLLNERRLITLVKTDYEIIGESVNKEAGIYDKITIYDIYLIKESMVKEQYSRCIYRIEK